MNVVLFGADTVAPCKAMRPLVVASCAVADTPFEYVDVESYDIRADDVSMVPTLRAYDELGYVIAERRGWMTSTEVAAFVEALPSD